MKNQLNFNTSVLICLLISACSSSSSYRGGDKTIGGDIQTLAVPATVPATVSTSELTQIKDFAFKAEMPLSSKSKLISMYISALAKKYNTSRASVSQKVSDYFKIKKDENKNDEYSKKNLIKLSAAVGNFREKVGIENGIGLEGAGSESVNLVSQSKAITVLRSNNLQQSILSTNELRKEKLRQEQIIFEAIDSEAQKNADLILAAVAQEETKNLENQDVIVSLKHLESDINKVEAMMNAARVAEAVGHANGASDEQKKGMVPYLANSILKYGLNSKLSKNGIKTNLIIEIDDSRVLVAAKSLGKICDALNGFAKDKSTKLGNLSQRLTDFSKDGKLKFDVSKAIDLDYINKIQDFAREIDSKVKEYTGDAQKLVDIAEDLGVNPKILNAAKKGIQIADIGEKALATIINPNPANVLEAIGSLMSAGPSSEEVMNEKLDTIVNMQQIELHDLTDIKEGIFKVQTEIAQTQSLIGDLSQQIAHSSQVIYDQLISVEAGIQKLAQLEQRTQRLITGATQCDRLASVIAEKKIRYSVSDKDQTQMKASLFPGDVAPYLDDCYKFVTRLNTDTDITGEFLDTREVGVAPTLGERYVTAIELLKLKAAKIDSSITANIALNPFENIFDLSNTYVNSKNLHLNPNDAASSAMETLLKQYSGKFDIFDSLMVAKYADLVTKISPLINLYQRYNGAHEESEAKAMGVLDVLGSMMKPDVFYLEWLANLMKIVNINIAQQVLLSGVSVAQADLSEILATNQAENSKQNCSKNFDTLYCLLNNDEISRRNVFMYSLYSDLKQKNKNTSNYDYASTLPHVSDQEIDYLLREFKLQLTNDWQLSRINRDGVTPWVVGVIARQTELMPSGDEMSKGVITYAPEMNVLLAARENLLDLITEMRLNEITDQNARDSIFAKVLRAAL